MSHNKRSQFRVPESRLITEFSKNTPFASSIVNVSFDGLYTVKPCESLTTPRGLIQLEIPVPEASESIWATGEVLYEHHGAKSVGTGIRFRNMAQFHRNLLRDLVESGRRQVLADMLQQILWQRQLAKYPTLFDAPAPPVTEHTVPMFRLADLHP
jgi:hypothetical protein